MGVFSAACYEELEIWMICLDFALWEKKENQIVNKKKSLDLFVCFPP